ncbi:hypothetical protein [Jiangella anatolica]|uniref:Glycoside hydrolase family 38 N-terminal domain-containing protein n=1 Tax=Jiangella anatolica TaxID=2670374 RepID=A0A2W2BA73_9ACTN|nr:hypothetical protein [Jiangella anatolica]PZF82110.1 hypothetical protein C1I92_18035 [Jiangella anatolica]
MILATPGVEVPAFQPGPLDAAAGWRDHRVELAFTVATADAHVLRLEFDAGHGPCPDLLIELDGVHRGLFHPAVRREDRSEVYRHGPIAGSVLLEVPLPAAWLGAGEHVLAMTTTLDPAAATGPVDVPADARGGRHREQFGHHFGSGITWRSLTLTPAGAAAPPAPSSTQLRATPLYPLSGGQLAELTVDVAAGAPWPAAATVTVGAESHALDLRRAGRDFGQVRVRLPVAELTGPTGATVTIGDAPAAAFTLAPQRKWTVHLIPHVHLDVGYTDVQGKVLELHSRNLDRALDALDRDDAFAFSVDGSLVVGQYLATRSEKRSQRVLDALRSGRLSVNAFHNLFLSGIASLEEVYRAAYLAARLRDDYGVPVSYANLTDVPSYSAAVPSMLRALGIDAFVGIENHHRGGNADSDVQHLASPVQWEGVDGSRVLTHFSDTYSQLRFMAGDPQTVAGGAHALVRLLDRYERDDYLPQDLPVIGTHADNEDLADGDAAFAARWNAVYAWPRVAVSTMAGYLDAVRPLDDRLPVWRGDGGSYWEDGVGTGAVVVAEHRRAQVALPAAEALAALVARADDTYRPNRPALDAAWDGVLYGSEHTWTWSHANAHPHGEQVGDQLDWKRHQVHTGYRTAIDETRRALSQLGELVTTDGPTVLAYNPLGWARDVEIEVEAPAGTLDGEVLADCDGLLRYRLTVPDVPPFGYRTVPLGAGRTLSPGEEDGSAAGATDTAAEDDWQPVPAVLETPRWRVDLDPATGTVTGLTHRPTGRSLLDDGAPWRLGQVLYVLNGPDELTRGTDPHAGIAHSGTPHLHPPAPRSTLSGRRPAADPPELTVTAATMRPVGVRRTHDGWRLRTVGAAPSLPSIEADVFLRDGSDRVDVTVRLTKERELAKESVYVAFPFAADAPRFHYDRQQGWIDPAADHAPGACHEWFTTQYGVVVESAPGGPAVAWTSADAPLFTAGDIVRGAWPERFEPASGSVLSWVMNNYWPTNTPPEQDGELTLWYAFTPLPAHDPAAAGRFGREVRSPAVVSEVTRLDKFDTDPRPLPATSASLLDLDLPPWTHATVAESRDRSGLLLRLQDLGGDGGTVRLPAAGGAVRCLADERETGPLPVDDSGAPVVELRPWEVVSVLLRGQEGAR